MMRLPRYLPMTGILGSYLLLSLVPFFPLLLGQSVDHPIHLAVIESLSWLALWALLKRPAWFHWLLIPAFAALPSQLYLNIHYAQGITTHQLGILVETSPAEAMEWIGSQIWVLVAVIVGVFLWWLWVQRLALRTRDLDFPTLPRWLALGFCALCLGLWVYGQAVGFQPEEEEDEEIASESVPAPVQGESLQPPSPSVSLAVAAQGDSASADDSAGTDEEDEEEEEEEEEVEEEDDPAKGMPWENFPKLPAWSRTAVDVGKEEFGSTWPFGLAVLGHDFYKERMYLAELAERSRQFSFGAHQNDLTPQVVVMVIGESSRFDRWSVNGYGRETNPRLKTEPNLVTFSNMIAAVSATRVSVPIMLTRKPVTQALKPGFGEKSLLSAYKEAGFKTWWFSNQMSFGKFDTPISVLAKEADVTEFLNLGGYTNESSYDQVLLKPFTGALSDAAPKKLIVLHTLGNHWNYSHRYPPEFDKWQPSLVGIRDPDFSDPKLRQALMNSYDNSVLYADWLLSQVIDLLKTSGPKRSAMFFISDHGEAFNNPKCGLAFHGHNTLYDFHVPALFWYSDAYRAAYPEKVKRLLKNRNARLSSENVFHSVVDMADVHYGGERLDYSFLSSKFRRHLRYVDSNGWSNYDNATMKGGCLKIVDKGKPLPQER